MRFLLLIAMALALTGCARPAPWSREDPDGIAVPLRVTMLPGFSDSPLVDAWTRRGGPRWRVSVGVGVGVGAYHGPYRYRGMHRDPFWDPWPPPDPPAVVTLLIGDGPAQGQVLRWRLQRGVQGTVLRLRPGRTATVSLRGDGAFDGFESIGTFTVQPGMTVDVVLDADGGRVGTTTSDGTVTAGSATPAGGGSASPAAVSPSPAPGADAR